MEEGVVGGRVLLAAGTVDVVSDAGDAVGVTVCAFCLCVWVGAD